MNSLSCPISHKLLEEDVVLLILEYLAGSPESDPQEVPVAFGICIAECSASLTRARDGPSQRLVPGTGKHSEEQRGLREDRQHFLILTFPSYNSRYI